MRMASRRILIDSFGPVDRRTVNANARIAITRAVGSKSDSSMTRRATASARAGATDTRPYTASARCCSGVSAGAVVTDMLRSVSDRDPARHDLVLDSCTNHGKAHAAGRDAFYRESAEVVGVCLAGTTRPAHRHLGRPHGYQLSG